MASAAVLEPIQARYGASEEEWWAFASDLAGLSLYADLLPVVMDPGAERAPRSAVTDFTKVPSWFNREGRAVGIHDWPKRRSTMRQVDNWASDPRLGPCLICRRVRAIDVDVPDPAAANAIADFVDSFLGVALPRRTRANSGKLAMLATVPSEAPIEKMSFAVEGGIVEFLGDLQHIVLAGTHASGARIEWAGGLPLSIPEVDIERYSALRQAMAEQFATGAVRQASTCQRSDDIEADDPVADFLTANGLTHGASADGRKLYVDCPKRGTHSRDGDATQTVWFVAGSGGQASGHFDCRHESHGKITDSEFLAAVGYVEDIAQHFQVVDEQPSIERAIQATPYTRRDPRKLPMRPWLYGRQIMRGALSLVVAPGATGKTALLVGTSLALASGRGLLGKEVHEAPRRVWLWNLEDNADELARMIEAACLHWDIGPGDLGDRLFVDSGVDGSDLCTATADRGGVKVLVPVMGALVEALRASEIDVLIVDPFVSSHRVPENDNGAIDAVAKAWARVAAEANCAIVLAHHVTKAAGVEVTAERARGASALVNAARSVLALNRMTPEEAGKLGIGEGERRRFFRAYDDKNNRAPPAENSDWFKLESVALGNAPDPLDHGDDIQVVIPWTPPRANEGIGDSELLRVQEKIAAGEWRKSEQAQQWVGRAVADELDIDLDAPGAKQRVRTLLKGWVNDGSLAEEMVPDAHRIPRPCIVVARWASPKNEGIVSITNPRCAGMGQEWTQPP